jgi:hypothetical protein
MNFSYLPLIQRRRCEKISLALFNVIPAKAGVRCFHEVTNILDPGFHRGDEYSVIFSHLRRLKWGFERILRKIEDV